VIAAKEQPELMMIHVNKYELILACTFAMYNAAAACLDSRSPEPFSKLMVSYQYEKIGGTQPVTKVFPSDYFAPLRQGDILQAVTLVQPECIFAWSFPELSVKAFNSTRQPVYFSEIVFSVSKSELNSEPVLIFDEIHKGTVLLLNEGWGPVNDPTLNFIITITPNGPTVSKTITLPTFEKSLYIDFAQYVPISFRSPPYEYTGVVRGTLSYTNAKQAVRQLKFESPLHFSPPPAPFFPPSPVPYNVRLIAGVAPTTVRVPISQVLKAGEPDHFLIRVASDRSAHFAFTITFNTVDAKSISAGEFILDTFVPRSGAEAATNAEQK
jgi:hypothetical protein